MVVALTGAKIGIRGMRVNSGNTYMRLFMNHLMPYADSIDEMIVIAADGVGYGSDGTSWGGEILYTNINDFERMGHLQSQLMPGGDVATRYPARMLASILKDEKLIKNY